MNRNQLPQPGINTLIVRTVTRGLMPVIVAMSLYLLWRGHNAPGGGFIAALVAGAGIVLRYLARGQEAAERSRWSFRTLLAGGVLISASSLLAPLLFGAPLGRGTIWEPELLGASLKIPSSLFFDVGVYLVVLGVIVGLIRYLGREQ